MRAWGNLHPTAGVDYNGVKRVYRGICIRDYVAIQAMIGIVTGSDSKSLKDKETIADNAYAIADAMLDKSVEPAPERFNTPSYVANKQDYSNTFGGQDLDD